MYIFKIITENDEVITITSSCITNAIFDCGISESEVIAVFKVVN